MESPLSINTQRRSCPRAINKDPRYIYRKLYQVLRELLQLGRDSWGQEDQGLDSTTALSSGGDRQVRQAQSC